MNPDEAPSFEEFLQGLQETQQEIETRRAAAWLKALEDINRVLDHAQYKADDPMRAALFNIMQTLWVKGYNSGVRDMSEYIARQAGMGPMMDMMKLAENQIIQKPENN